MAPDNLKGFYDEDTLEKYSRNVEDSLDYIFTELKCVATDVFGIESDVFKRICDIEQYNKNAFYSCGYDIEKFKTYYKNFISNMDSRFIDRVKEECVGYTDNLTSAVEDANTVNELLHFMHSYIVNNDMILSSIPLVSEKQNNYKYPISYRGVNNPLFKKIFEDFPNELDCGWTDMVGITDKKLLMMVRDRGHALTIETTLLNDDKARIEYFVPKLCNVDMINALPGLSNKVDRNSVGASGVIEVPQEELSETLFNFISKVPTDNDIVFEHQLSM
jgi:hypothetical protein